MHRGETHLAGSHLLDEATGEYNLAFVRRYVPGRALVVVNLVHRIQGFIVPPGNPRSVTTLADLTCATASAFVNRQRGSGTRVLLDYLLKQQDIVPAQIQRDEREDFTHLAVAVAVAGRRVDVGLGALSVARALGMDFVALRNEQYDLVILREFYDSELLQPLLALIRSQAFQQQVEALGGYDALDSWVRSSPSFPSAALRCCARLLRRATSPRHTGGSISRAQHLRDAIPSWRRGTHCVHV